MIVPSPLMTAAPCAGVLNAVMVSASPSGSVSLSRTVKMPGTSSLAVTESLTASGASLVQIGADAALGGVQFVINGVTQVEVGGTTGNRIGLTATHKVGFYGATPVARPASTPAAATDPATTMALVNDLRTKLITLMELLMELDELGPATDRGEIEEAAMIFDDLAEQARLGSQLLRAYSFYRSNLRQAAQGAELPATGASA